MRRSLAHEKFQAFFVHVVEKRPNDNFHLKLSDQPTVQLACVSTQEHVEMSYFCTFIAKTAHD